MRGPRKHVITGLLILMWSLSEHCSESAPSTVTARATGGVAQRNLRRTVEIVRHVEGSRGHHNVKTEAPFTSRAGSSSVELLRDFRTRTERNQGVVLSPKDFKTKEKIIKYFTGPLVFSPKCRKNAYRLYHLTRDCTIPAYFKRCARLLTRLAGSPQCTEG